jgi:hypothetical protein
VFTVSAWPCILLWLFRSYFLLLGIRALVRHSFLPVMEQPVDPGIATGCIYMYVSTASPNRASLGATNGIAQFLVSITRMIGPAASTSLFSLSMAAEGFVGSGLIYIVLLMASLATIAFGTTLPRQVWES